MATNVYPSADTAGFITDDNEIATRVLMDYMAANHSQSNSFKVNSLEYTVAEYGGDAATLVGMIQKELSEQYNLYLNNVNVEVTFNIDASGKIEVVINVMYATNGNTITLGQALTVNQSTLERIAELEYR